MKKIENKTKTVSKILSAVLAVCVIMGITSLSAFAATLDQSNTSGSATVYYQAGQVTDDNGTPEDPTDDVVGGTYLVTIPAFIEAADVNGTPTEYDVTAKDVLIPYGTSLKISVDFENNLKLEDDNSVTVGYDLQARQGSGFLASINTGAAILAVDAGNPDTITTSSISAVLTDTPVYAGTYTNTATFNITVD